MQEPASPFDFLRYVSNSDKPLPGDPTLKDIRDRLKPRYPWIFSPELSSDKIDDFFDFNGTVVLGQGFQAVVKTAINKSDGSKVACKCFKRQPPGHVPSEDTPTFTVPEAAFLRELYCLTFLPQGPGFIQLLGCYLTETEIIIIISLHGVSLHNLRSQNQFPYEKTRQYAREMFKIIQQLTKNGIWHCDTVLQNWLLNADNDHLTLIDFGYAFSSNQKVHSPIHPWTVTSVPPERNFEGWFYPEKSMVWTLGDNVYRMMTGSPIFASANPLSIEEQKEIFEKEYQINPDWPEEVRIFLKAALAEEEKRMTINQLQELELFK